MDSNESQVAPTGLPLSDGSTAPLAGAQLIAAERQRQIAVELWTPSHDEQHEDGSLAEAAVAYARYGDNPRFANRPPGCWPWGEEWWKPCARIRALTKAGALIAAEIDRLQRLSNAEVSDGSGS